MDDEKLSATLPVEAKDGQIIDRETIGYTVARQAPNGFIHPITTKNHPSMHFELNEAWILSPDAGMPRRESPEVMWIEHYTETYLTGKVKAQWSGGMAAEGNYLLDGRQEWFHENGQKQWDVTCNAGIKVGEEKRWDASGRLLCTWRHAPTGQSTWTQYWDNGQKRSESQWNNHRAVGVARRWDREGRLVGQTEGHSW